MKDIVKQCEFKKMAEEKIPKEVAEFMFKNDYKFFRKGMESSPSKKVQYNLL